MMTSARVESPQVGLLRPAIRGRAILEVAGFVLLTALAAQVQVRVPGLLVPVTLQSLAVLLCGYALSPGKAMAAMSAYLAAGTVVAKATGGVWGLFTPGSVGLFGPTAGYLVGFVLMAPVVSVVFRRWPGLFGTLVAGVCGTVILFFFGVVWLVFWLGSVTAAVGQGLTPFIPGAVVTLAVAASAVETLRAARRRRGR